MPPAPRQRRCGSPWPPVPELRRRPQPQPQPLAARPILAAALLVAAWAAFALQGCCAGSATHGRTGGSQDHHHGGDEQPSASRAAPGEQRTLRNPHVQVVTTEFLDGEDLASVVDAAYGEGLHEPYRRFKVILEHVPNSTEGLAFVEEFNSLYISEMDSDTMIGGWNGVHPSRAVKLGDRVVDVNGKHGRAEHLQSAMHVVGRLELTILRVPRGPLSAPAPAKFYEIMLDRTDGQSFGVYCSMSEQSLLIKGIGEGLFADWNKEMKEQPDAQVHPGDRIVLVNSQRGSGKALLESCDQRGILEIRLLRGEGPTKVRIVEEDLHPGDAGDIAFEEITMTTTKTTTKTTITHTSTRTVTDGSTSTAIPASSSTKSTSSAPAPSTSSTSTTPTTSTKASTTTGDVAAVLAKALQEEAEEEERQIRRRENRSAAAVPPVPSAKYDRGLKAEYFYDISMGGPGANSRQKFEAIFEKRPDMVRIEPKIYYPLSLYGFPGVKVKQNFAVRWTGQLLIARGGIYTFSLRSDDGSTLALDGRLLLGRHDHPDYDEHIWVDEPEHWLYLRPGQHTLEVKYFNTELHAGCILSYMGTDTRGLWVTVPSEALRSPAELVRSALLRKYEPEASGGSRGGAVSAASGPWQAAGAATAAFAAAGFLAFTGLAAWGTKAWSRGRRGARPGGGSGAGELRRILAATAPPAPPAAGWSLPRRPPASEDHAGAEGRPLMAAELWPGAVRADEEEDEQEYN